jgi:type II secretory pathway component PulC
MKTTKNGTPASKSRKISRIYDDIVIDAVKCFAFTAKKSYGKCALSGQSISKGDKCEMLILEDGTKVTTLLSTTLARGKKADKVQSTSRPSKKVAKPTAKAVKKTTKPTAKAVTKKVESTNHSEAVISALAELAKANDAVAKYNILVSLPTEVMTIVANLTK